MLDADDLGGPDGILIGNSIMVRAGGCRGWRAFIIGHELAHAVCGDWAPFAPQGCDWHEHEMDAIAAELLSPRRWRALANVGLERHAKPASLFC